MQPRLTVALTAIVAQLTPKTKAANKRNRSTLQFHHRDDATEINIDGKYH